MSKASECKVYDTVTVGERGQVVIPITVRKLLKIKPGGKLVVMASKGVISLVPVEKFNTFINRFSKFMDNITKFRNNLGREK
jgi:AbrB family looped-hinge helix DNA binding protein